MLSDIVEAGEDDRPFLFAMFLQAAFWSGPPEGLDCEQVGRDPALGQYVRGWGRPGDTGLIARERHERAGAAWYRLFTAADPGYGFVDEDTPELGLAVVGGRRGAGVGRRLLLALLARARLQGYRALSLSVSHENDRALRLYRSLGFTPLHDVGGSTTMKVDL